MRRYPFAIALLALSFAAHAGSTLRVGSQVLTVGDSATHALELLGTPAYKEPVENEYGAHRGERWQYQRGSHVVTVTIIAGKVGEIEDRVR